jgi:hypothetical protein
MLSGIAVGISIGVLLFFDAFAIRSSGSAAVAERLVEGLSAWLVAALCLFRALSSALKWRQLKRTSSDLDAEPAVRLKFVSMEVLMEEIPNTNPYVALGWGSKVAAYWNPNCLGKLRP